MDIIIQIDESKIVEYGSIFISNINPEPEKSKVQMFIPGFKFPAGKKGESPAMSVSVESDSMKKAAEEQKAGKKSTHKKLPNKKPAKKKSVNRKK